LEAPGFDPLVVKGEAVQIMGESVSDPLNQNEVIPLIVAN
jgi:hypothetical protein